MRRLKSSLEGCSIDKGLPSSTKVISTEKKDTDLGFFRILRELPKTMSSEVEEILDFLPWSLAPDLIELYNDEDINYYFYYLVLQLCHSWHTSFSDRNIHILTPNGKVDEHGSFFVIFPKFLMVIFNTRNQNLDKMKLLLGQFVRKHGHWLNINFGPVEKRFWTILEEAMSENKMKLIDVTLARRYFMDKESARQLPIICPEDVYISGVKEEDAQLIDSVWPHRFDGSLNLIKMIIRRNGGIGLYLKENDNLVSWALHGIYNGPQIFQTAESHRRKGYGYLIASAISKYFAERNMHSVLYIVDKNTPSQLLFEKLGYKTAENVKWYLFIEKKISETIN